MAGMFYSIEEVAEKLNKTTDQIKQLVQDGKLREFRDGQNLLFKVDEVDMLVSDSSIMASPEEPIEIEQTTEEDFIIPDDFEIEGTAEEEITLADDSDQASELADEDTIAADDQINILDETEKIPEELSLASEDSAPIPELTDEDTVAADEGISLLDETDSKFQLPEQTSEQSEPSSDELLVTPSEDLSLADESSGDSQDATDEISLASPTEESSAEDVLGETQLTSDTAGLTGSGEAELVSADEASLEEIEEDVNLDSFGSGSGLLDLSLQADDTSLGGILDEIYTPEGDEDQSAESASMMDVTADAEQMLADEDFAAPTSAAILHATLEPEPDTMSNAFGYMLLVPFAVVIYTTIIAITGFNDITPAILKGIQNLILPIMGGAAVVAGLIIGIPFMMSGGSSGKKTKTKKAKTPKKAKNSKK